MDYSNPVELRKIISKAFSADRYYPATDQRL